MSESTQANPVGQINGLIIKVMEEIGVVGKTGYNDQQRYNFRGIDELYNAAQPALIKAGVFSAPQNMEMLSREERKTKSGGLLIYTMLKVTYHFCAPDGSYVAVQTIGEGMDSGDKSCNKAVSAAHKYAITQLLSVPTEEAKDSENDSHDVAPRHQQGDRRNQQRPPQRQQQQAPRGQQQAPTGTAKPSHQFYRDLAGIATRLGIHSTTATEWIKHSLTEQGFTSTDQLKPEQLKAILGTLGEKCPAEKSKVGDLTAFALFKAAKGHGLSDEDANAALAAAAEVIEADGGSLRELTPENRKKLIADVAAGHFDPQPA